MPVNLTVVGKTDVGLERKTNEDANERGGGDNITVIVAGVRGDLPAIVAGDRISDALQVVQKYEPRRPAGV